VNRRRGNGHIRSKSVAAKWLLAAGLVAAIVGGCSCEGPRARVPTMGAEVPRIRVRLGDEAPSMAVAVTGPWRLTGSAGRIVSGSELVWTEVKCGGGGVAFGDRPAVAGPVELEAERPGSLWVRQMVGGQWRDRSYRGLLRLVPTESGTVRVINVVPLEAYLAGVLANELIRSWHVEAYKAQAVAARTYAVVETKRRGRYDFDVYDSTRSQVYGGVGTETKTSWAAVLATWGLVAAYAGPEGKPVLLKTYYHSTCGGETAPAGGVFGGPTPPPLAGGVKCTFCRNSSKYRWPDVVLLKSEIGDALHRSGMPELERLGPVQRLSVAETTAGGRAAQIRVVDAAGTSVLVRADWWRSLVGAGKVPSTWFTVEDQPDRIVLRDGRGYGHGVGLCQWGAEFLAAHGKTGEQILRYYYPKVQLVRGY